MDKIPNSLKIGTSSWKYESWQDIVYPEKHSKYFLNEYSEHFNTVEVDQWFWSLFRPNIAKLPKIEMAQNYNQAVPEDFRFAVKVPNSITLTHFYKENKDDELQENPYYLSNELFEKFLQRLEPMKDKIGPIIFQFRYLNKNMYKKQGDFMHDLSEFIKKCPEENDYFIETRNPNYLNKGYFIFLRDHGLYHTFLQGYYMPPIFRIYQTHKDLLQDKVAIRLHGTDRKKIEKKTGKNWNRIVEPHDHDISQLKPMLEELIENDFNVFLYVNNHYEGSAPLTIKRIKEKLTRDIDLSKINLDKVSLF
ncbi:MAG: DUF72 domain-containing protein [Candidatus Zixiibacteriota bacterium]